jgi:C4-dicarboxylate-specific signal transduction histidine kinase
MEPMEKVNDPPVYSMTPSEAEVLMRKLARHYYGVFVLNLFDGVVHNLNGPLQSLFIRSEQVEQNLIQLQGSLQSSQWDKVDQLASRIAERVKGIAKNLDGLNTQIRSLSSHFVLDRRPEMGEVQLNNVIEACQFVLNANMFFKHEVRTTFRLNDALPPVRAREADLSVIVLNLVQNALEAMAETEEKHLMIETGVEDNQVVLRIQDSGCGIKEKDLTEIFRPFFTTKSVMKSGGDRNEHAGLGLSIASFLLKEWEGSISCESLPDKTTFTVQMPGVSKPPGS